MPRPLLVFDLDGTLIDSSEGICTAVNQARELLGYPSAEKDFLRQRIGLPALVLFEDLDLPKNQLTTAVDTFRDYLANTLEKGVEFFPGVLEFLDSAKSNNFFTAIATNKPLVLASQLVLGCELNELIDLTIGVGELLPKPNPSMISYCSEYFRVTDTTMFGDRVEDMQAAKLAGARAVGVQQGFHTRNQLLDSGANHVFPDFFQIHKFFDSNIWEK